MTTKSFCDLCSKEIDYKSNYSIYAYRQGTKNYCPNCWMNKKNWPKIHRHGLDVSCEKAKLEEKSGKATVLKSSKEIKDYFKKL